MYNLKSMNRICWLWNAIWTVAQIERMLPARSLGFSGDGVAEVPDTGGIDVPVRVINAPVDNFWLLILMR
ncbi:hypothetical protein KR51_00004490 [Rubidibacter lacunae KORDI 51-2]|uniref:Uncharacterized protein n=1 Tax=Rubidibacter lacunae KORDI 51-2 TaxID=582515 RepID=U5DT17_9CHRO|nr:hypothetical protein KR51_00004490 [Rubidibacter lacunae KORDI 51-2]